MAKIEMFKKALALPEVIQNVELTGILKELYTDYLELLEKNNELKDKLRSIDDIADIKKRAKVRNGFYTLDGVKDAEGNEIEPDCIENCKSGNFSATVRINIRNGESLIKDISGTFTVTDYDTKNRSFEVEIEQINQ